MSSNELHKTERAEQNNFSQSKLKWKRTRVKSLFQKPMKT